MVTVLNSLFVIVSVFMSEFLKLADDNPVLEFAQVPFNHPLYIMFSSGTTGAPKCMVHSVGVSANQENLITANPLQSFRQLTG